MDVLNQAIDNLIEDPSEENKKLFIDALETEEYNVLVSADKLEFKSREYFKKRQEAFALRSKIAINILYKWNTKFNTSEGCPLQYRDTLNIPFREIKKKD